MADVVKRCECAVCLYSAEVERNLEAIPDAQRSFFEDMYIRLYHAEDDVVWYRCLLEELYQRRPT